MLPARADTLELTPTWVIAIVCFFFIAASLGVERGLHYISKVLKRWHEEPLSEALEKIKDELMLVGFISLLLSVFQPAVANLCMKKSLLYHMLPCTLPDAYYADLTNFNFHAHGRKLFSSGSIVRRFLSGGGGSTKCLLKGKVPIISSEGLHQLHIFLFVMAIVHLFYCCFTMLLGRAKIRWWKPWEEEVVNVDQKRSLEVLHTTFNRLRHQTFLERRANHLGSQSKFFNWLIPFLRHLSCEPVTRADYLALRTGFLKKYNLSRDFDFHRYITQVFENDFKTVVGISAYMWAFVILFLLMNVHGWYTYLWMAFIPLILTLVVGTKLQHIISKLAIELAVSVSNRGDETFVRPRDELFWFSRPRFTLHIIHFTSFQNAYELAFFFWILITFGTESCYLEGNSLTIIRILLGAVVQILCGYSTLPLYAIVTQMGSDFNRAIFAKILKDMDMSHDKIEILIAQSHKPMEDSDSEGMSGSDSGSESGSEEGSEGHSENGEHTVSDEHNNTTPPGVPMKKSSLVVLE